MSFCLWSARRKSNCRHFGAGTASPTLLQFINGDGPGSHRDGPGSHRFGGGIRSSFCAKSHATAPLHRRPVLSCRLLDLGLHVSGHSLCRGNHSSALHGRNSPPHRGLYSSSLVPGETSAAHLGADPRQPHYRDLLLSRRPRLAALGRAEGSLRPGFPVDCQRADLGLLAVSRGGKANGIGTPRC